VGARAGAGVWEESSTGVEVGVRVAVGVGVRVVVEVAAAVAIAVEAGVEVEVEGAGSISSTLVAPGTNSSVPTSTLRGSAIPFVSIRSAGSIP